MTHLELELINSLRRKIGDNPTRVITSNDIGTTVYINGVPKVATLSDVNQITSDTSKQIWSDQELLSEIYDAFYIVFRNTKKRFEELDDLEKRIVVLAARIELTLQLATDAARYIKYQAQSINVTPVAPSELINLSKALAESLKEILDDYVGSESDKIKMGIMHFTDRHSSLLYPTNYALNQSLPQLELEYDQSRNCVIIFSEYVFISDFRTMFIQKEVDSIKTIVYETEVLKSFSFEDFDIIKGKTYTYTLYLQTLNGEMLFEKYQINIPNAT